MKSSFYFIALAFSIFSSCANNHLTRVEEKRRNALVSSPLYIEIAKMDSLIFSAFNAHDTQTLMRFFTSDVEFYHDKGGLSNFEQTTKGFANLFAQNVNTGLRRDLVAGSLEVYAINNYGAVETCLHRFCHVENGKDDCGTFKNIMIWKKMEGNWKVSRVISYDH